MRHLIATALVMLMPLASLAAPPHTAVLDVQNMTCGLCPVTVKKSLEKVAGVSQAQIDFAKKTATVTFDADKTNATALAKATTDAVQVFGGYGYTKEYPIEMGIRGVRSYSIGAEGGMNIMRMIIARELIGGEYTSPR